MNIKYTDHALDRLAERGITKKDVELALKQGKTAKPAAYGKMKNIHKNKKGVLSVVYNVTMPKPLTVIIITAYIE